MKLITKYNRVTIPIILAMLLISSVAYYFIIHYALIYQLDKDLRIEQQEIIQHVKETGSLPKTLNYKDQQIEFHSTDTTDFKEKFSTENVYDQNDEEEESLRRIDFLIFANGINYIAIVKKSEQETEDIVQLILTLTFSIIFILLLILFISNRFLLSKLWKPFNDTLSQLKQFNLSSKNKIVLGETNVDEFKELNQTVVTMTEKVSSDYETLKSFTENASHEIQTPLAIIKNKIELLSQSETLSEAELNVMQNLNEAASRISRLNQSLLLLAKIENRQFEITERINLSSILHRYIGNFEELAATKNIAIDENIAENIFLEVNESLAEILISNIYINAIKHNYENGKIQLTLDSNALTVSNTGEEPQEETSHFFERFKRSSASADSLGLGLSIVKTICDTYHFASSYSFENGMHILQITFGNRK